MLHDRTRLGDNVTAEALARWHDHEAERAMGSLHCGSENWEYRAAGRAHDIHRQSAELIRRLAGAASLAGMDY
ncbi:hypothetical protein UFOVP1244_107 [uncultured Caudovirales phage]|uniref:Uncharacterized protein n=1 Tax=uncultured Caudovirales phage TaxID=2100421 RepID=A0A6J5REG5_9CAUD|nr:hypothetical protein UFOVP1244_107 [uncultured Caudovirales phage]